MKKIIFYLLMGLIFVSCGEKKETAKTEKVESEEKDSVIQETETIETDSLPLGLEMFTNMEQIPFCIPLPLNNYTLNEELSDEKAKFVFTHNENPEFYIQVQGMFRSDPTVSIEDYFANSYPVEDEEQGKIVTTKQLEKELNCFYALGYWSNFPNRTFMEITWLREDDVVTLYAIYDQQFDPLIHFQLTSALIRKTTPNCK